MKVLITRSGYRCDPCGHEWVARGRRPPRICPRCKRRQAAAPEGVPPPGRRIDDEFWNPVSLDTIVARQGGPKIFRTDQWKRADFLPRDFDVDEFLAPMYGDRRRSRG